MAQFKKAADTVRGKGNYQGMNWIRQEKRLAIYLRDGLACCYCGAGVTEGTQLTLDHLVPHIEGGSNKETNLVTCCQKCNSSRGARPYTAFAAATAGYLNHGIKPEDIIAHIAACIARPLNMAEAKEVISRQGSCFAALNHYGGRK